MSRCWPRRCGSSSGRRPGDDSRARPTAAWQYSIRSPAGGDDASIALLFGALRSSTLAHRAPTTPGGTSSLLTLGDVVLVTSIVLVWQWASWLAVIGGRGSRLCSCRRLQWEPARSRLRCLGLLGRDLQYAHATWTGSASLAYTLVASAVVFAYLELTPILGRQPETRVRLAACASREMRSIS